MTARKLPLQTRRHGKRLVWCLLISQVPFLYSLFDWKQVAPERRAQLRQATEAQVQLANLAYQTMQQLSAWYLELAAFWHQIDERSDHESQG